MFGLIKGGKRNEDWIGFGVANEKGKREVADSNLRLLLFN
jgi:hypothetical protein